MNSYFLWALIACTSVAHASLSVSSLLVSDGAGHPLAIAVDSPNGVVYTIGNYTSSITFGATVLTSSGLGDIFLVKSNATDGSVIWAVSYGGANANDFVKRNSLAVDSSGNVYFGGTFSTANTDIGGTSLTLHGSYDAFFARVNPGDGTINWVVNVAGPGEDQLTALTIYSANGTGFAAGYFSGSPGPFGFTNT